ncbi:hypothetical protein HanIR_Chr17g0863741 [Helianthus annuus]|nr:hypothetical protein HanIR_Chr17g0863741 [Helianthus annuus]
MNLSCKPFSTSFDHSEPRGKPDFLHRHHWFPPQYHLQNYKCKLMWLLNLIEVFSRIKMINSCGVSLLMHLL